MNQLSRMFLTVALLASAITLRADCCDTSNTCSPSCGDSVSSASCFSRDICGAPSICVDQNCCSKCYSPSTYIPRSADSNTALLWGLPFMHKADMDCNYGGSLFAVEYTRSFNAKQLANCLFGACDGNLLFQGSAVAGRSTGALVADYFGLSQDFNGALALKPVIQNVNVHYVGYMGLDRYLQGLWFKLDFTFSHQQRSLTNDCVSTNSLCNTSCNASCNTSCNTSCNACPAIPDVLSANTAFPAGYMGAAAVAPATTIQQALSGDFLFGEMVTPWIGGRWNFCNSKKNGVAGLSLNLGYDLYNCEENYFGVFFRTTAPTGSKSSSRNVFSAIVGNGQYWELGGGISGKWEFWNRNDCQKLAFLLDGYVTTLLKSTHLRTFDLNYTATTASISSLGCGTGCSTGCSVSCGNSCNNSCEPLGNCTTNALSRYVLLKELTRLDDGTYSNTGNVINAVNLTTRNARVNVSVKGDATLRMLYSHGGFDFGVGYNIYGQSHEKISKISTFCQTGTGFYGITTFYGVKGCQGVAFNAFATVTSGSAIASPLVVSSIPENNVTSRASNAYCCGAADNFVAAAQPLPGEFIVAYNSNSDNATIVAGAPIATLEAAADYIPWGISDPAVIATTVDLDICSGGAPRQLTNKGFVTFDYTWQDHDYLPYVGFGAEVEGGGRNLDLAQWGLWIRGGLSY